MNRNCKDFFILMILAETLRSGHSNTGRILLVLVEPYEEKPHSFIWYHVLRNPVGITGGPVNVRLHR